jgi:2-desacetyl-2-hydroxyethyl bacteriochlorophyllide A dehydrogenase
MKVLCCTQPGSLQYQERKEPIPAPGRAILKIKRIGICGTDLHSYSGTQPFFEYPRILGHELSAEIVDAGYAAGFQNGDPVTIIPYFNCGLCIACRTGKTNCCASLQVCGVHMDGGMVEYLSVPHYALIGSEGLSYDQLALTEPMAIGAHAVTRAGINENDTVLVVGAGPIGLAVMQFARVAGARLIVMDNNPSRLTFCGNFIQPENSIGHDTTDIVATLREMTHGDMPSIVMDATGNQIAINQEFQFMAHGGKYILVGLQKNEIHFSHPEFHKREATLMSSRNATRSDFERVLDCISSGRIDPLPMITHRTQFDQTRDQFPNWLDPAKGTVKAMVAMDA